MKFIHISDLHIDSIRETIYGVNPVGNLKKAIRLIKDIPGVDYIIASGDISNDGTEESYRIADSILSELGLPVYAVVGNHDDKDIVERIKDDLSYIRFQDRLDVGNKLRFRFLDSVMKSEDGGNKCRGFLSEALLASLREDLSSDTRKNILVIHHPSVEQGGDWIDRKMLVNRDEFKDAVISSGKVLAVLSGHYHSSATDYLDGILFSIAPSTSTTYGITLKPYEEAYTPGFDVLDIDIHYNIRKRTIYL